LICVNESIHIFYTLHVKQNIELHTNIQALSIIFANLFENTTFKEIDLAIEAKPADAKFSPQLRRFRKAVDGKFPILQVVSQPGIFLKKGHGEYLIGYDRLLMAL